jgi:hypothetical protein
MKKIALFIVSLMLISIAIADTNKSQSNSVYDSIRSGWNAFIDVLAGKNSRGPESKQNEKSNTTSATVAPTPGK